MNEYKTEEEELEDLKRVILDPSADPIDLSFSLLRCITRNFSDEIGSGAWSTVYKGVLPNGLCVAVKRLASSVELFLDDHNEVPREVTATMRAKHNNIARLIGYCSETRQRLVMYNGGYVLANIEEKLICVEYVPNGDLEGYITDESRGHELDQRCQIMKGLCEALFYLHEKARIVHGDLKPGNILLDNNNMPKICDFGSSQCPAEGESVVFVDKVRGTIGYMAPEMTDRWQVSFKSDIYSLGIIVKQLFNRVGWSVDEDIEQVLARWRERLKKEGANSSLENKCKVVRRCLEIAYKCTEYDPDERPTALDIIQLLDETESTNSSFTSGHDNPMCQPGEAEPAPTNVQDTDTKSAKTSSNHLRGDEEPDIANMDAQRSTQKHDKPDLVTPLPEKLSSLDFLKKITDGFSEKLIVGKVGASGFVYKGTIPDAVIAVKRLCALPIPEEKFTTGSEQLMRLDHDNIVKLVGYCHDASNKQKVIKYKDKNRLLPGPEQLLCYTYLPNGSLRHYLIGGSYKQVEWQKRYAIIKGTCEGLRYLHEDCPNSPIVHLNLSLSNILLDENNAPRIADVGVSWLIGEKDNKTMADTMEMPVGYMAPEYLKCHGGELEFPTKADIYSLGIVILEIVTGQENRGRELAKTVKENWTKDSHVQSVYTSLKEADMLGQVKLCIDIGLKCANMDQHKRPTAGDIIRRLNYQGNQSVPVAPLPISTDDHNRGKEESTNTITAAPIIEKKPGFWNILGKCLTREK